MYLYAFRYRFNLAEQSYMSGLFGFCGFYNEKELLDGTVVASNEVEAETKALKKLKNKYKNYGFEIEQVKQLYSVQNVREE